MMKKLSSLLFLVIATVIITGSCDKEDPQGGNNEDQINTPTVTTGEVTNIESTTATCFGNVKADGGATVTARGVCWSTAENPSTSDSKTTDGTGKGTYTSNLTDLTPDTQYYARAYATNSKGTAYGQQKAFKTQDEIFTDSRDGKVYKYVTIGNQVWMAENLAYLPVVSPPTTYSYSSSHYYVYGYEGTDVNAAKAVMYYTTYGVLYNWPAATRACPEGWHLPSEAEWKELTNYLGGASVAGGKMKEKGFAHWREPNEGATNESGFTALPSGRRCGILKNFQSIENTTYFWSSSEGTGSHVWYWILNYDNARVGSNDYFKDNGFSVRCIRD